MAKDRSLADCNQTLAHLKTNIEIQNGTIVFPHNAGTILKLRRDLKKISEGHARLQSQLKQFTKQRDEDKNSDPSITPELNIDAAVTHHQECEKILERTKQIQAMLGSTINKMLQQRTEGDSSDGLSDLPGDVTEEQIIANFGGGMIG